MRCLCHILFLEVDNDTSAMDTNESTSTVQQSDILQSTEYKYMVHMLKVANTKKEQVMVSIVPFFYNFSRY